MKNNYTKRLFDVLQYSREEAVRLQSSYIGPEHLMLGILRDGNGIAYDTLAELDVNLSLLKKKIEQNLKCTSCHNSNFLITNLVYFTKKENWLILCTFGNLDS